MLLAWRWLFLCLLGSERAFSLRYGFHPKSYSEGFNKGAELTIVLLAPSQPPRHISHRHLDPSHRSIDRQQFHQRIVLPPFAADSDLIVLTSVGANGDDA
jgi:hypothetical protein